MLILVVVATNQEWLLIAEVDEGSAWTVFERRLIGPNSQSKDVNSFLNSSFFSKKRCVFFWRIGGKGMQSRFCNTNVGAKNFSFWGKFIFFKKGNGQDGNVIFKVNKGKRSSSSERVISSRLRLIYPGVVSYWDRIKIIGRVLQFLGLIACLLDRQWKLIFTFFRFPPSRTESATGILG